MRINSGRSYCYVSGSIVEQFLIRDDAVLAALIDQLRVPGSAAYLRGLPPEDKLDLVEREIEHRRGDRHCEWFGVDAVEILMAMFFRAAPRRKVKEVFGQTRKEDDLRPAVTKWLLKEQSHDAVYKEIKMGTKRADLVAHTKKTFWGSDKVVAVELKNDLVQLEHAWAQMTTYGQHSHHVYLACPPYLGVEYLNKHAKAARRWEPGRFNAYLEDQGFGLLVVYSRQNVVIPLVEPRPRSPGAAQVQDALQQFSPACRVAG